MTNGRLILIVFLCLLEGTAAFANLSRPAQQLRRHSHHRSIWGSLKQAATADSDNLVLTLPEQKVFGILEEIHASKLNFRVVVVGNGAILETTHILGPTLKLSQAPGSGKNLVTFASEDQSFEFHLMIGDVSKIVLTEKQGPKRVMKILRFLNDVGKPICSLILADDSEASMNWYQAMTTKYGGEVQL